jgi:GMP synthase-like glutamine amidotransferase
MPAKPILVLQHEPAVSLGSLEPLLFESVVPFVRLEVTDAGPPRLPLDRAAGLIVLGGTMSAYDDGRYAFLAREADWLREAIERPLPVLGICLGAQLMARALGARVYRHHTREIGWFAIQRLPQCHDDPLFFDAERQPTVFHWHGDTFDLPEGAIRLARGIDCGTSRAGPSSSPPPCENQAFRFGPWNYAVQFHVEMTPRLMQQWLADPEFTADLSGEPHVDLSQIAAEAPQRFAAMEPFARRILRRFIARCRKP